MRKLFYFCIGFFLLVPLSAVSAQYPTCVPLTCSQPPYSGCVSEVGPGSFPVCNHGADNCGASWSCTQTTGCTDDTAWSSWSGCGPDVCGETRYCINSSCCGNAAEAQDCAGQCGNPDPDPTPTPNPASKSCGILISGSSVSFSGSYAPAGNTVRLWVARQDKAAISPAPANQGVYVEPIGSPIYPYTAYRVDSCVISGSGTCAKTYTIPSLPANSYYYFHCDIQNAPDMCSGQPFCNYENPPMPGGLTCPGYRSCSNNDNGSYITVIPTVTPTPTSTPMPTPTPTPPTGTIQARGVQVSPADTSCAAIKAVPITDGQINGMVLQFTPSSASQPAPKTQAGAAYAVFANALLGSYTLDPIPPIANWAYVRPCWTNITTGATGEGLTRTLVASQTIRWDIGYTLGTPWVQVQGGDVYASGTLRSFIPAVIPRVFNGNGTGGYPGIIQYGSSCDFDSDPIYNGCTQINPPTHPLIISSTNWQVNASRTTVNYYDLFYRRYSSPTTPYPFANLLAVTKPASSETPYYVVGNMTTSSNWSVGSGESVVFIVNGNLTIGGRVNITGDGFVAFIVNGSITVADTVGTTSVSTTPVVEGVYLATKADQSGVFQTGTSVAAATARFVGSGMFVADTFISERDLEGFGGGNTASSAELFVYDPQLLLTMPDEMKDLSVTWQEVAP